MLAVALSVPSNGSCHICSWVGGRRGGGKVFMASVHTMHYLASDRVARRVLEVD